MGYRWRNDPLTGERILMNDAEVEQNNRGAVMGAGVAFTLLIIQMALPSETSTLIRWVVGVLSLGIGVLLGLHVLGIVVAIAAFLAALFILGYHFRDLGELWFFCGLGAVANVMFFTWQARPQVARPPPPATKTDDRPQGFGGFNERADEIARLHGFSERADAKATRRKKKPKGFKSNFD